MDREHVVPETNPPLSPGPTALKGKWVTPVQMPAWALLFVQKAVDTLTLRDCARLGHPGEQAGAPRTPPLLASVCPRPGQACLSPNLSLLARGLGAGRKTLSYDSRALTARASPEVAEPS